MGKHAELEEIVSYTDCDDIQAKRSEWVGNAPHDWMCAISSKLRDYAKSPTDRTAKRVRHTILKMCLAAALIDYDNETAPSD